MLFCWFLIQFGAYNLTKNRFQQSFTALMTPDQIYYISCEDVVMELVV